VAKRHGTAGVLAFATTVLVLIVGSAFVVGYIVGKLLL